MLEYKEVIKAFINEESLTMSLSEVKALDNKLQDNNDFYFEIEGKEYRFISDSVIEETFEEYCIDLFDDCYMYQVPEQIKRYIDYGKFVEDCRYDGYAHSFSSYDGYTHIETDVWNIFRTN